MLLLLFQVVKPNIEKLMVSGVAEMLQAANPREVVPTCPTVDSILLAVPRPARLPEISREVRGCCLRVLEAGRRGGCPALQAARLCTLLNS
jgi:hypothetical protein